MVSADFFLFGVDQRMMKNISAWDRGGLLSEITHVMNQISENMMVAAFRNSMMGIP
jgi:hypothetical protein